ncbi:MAG: pyridoxamine 5'-phosphate oxidase family protein [Bacteroidales bacterium]|nr:pyridoxamine 5'-phosphate oxidase family protein [Bacteroidales bacterium]
MKTITINDVAAYLDMVGLQYMATIGLDSKPKVRPVQYMVIEDCKLWFCTNSKKLMYQELQANPSLEICGSKLEEDEIMTPWIRFSAEAVFEENQKVKQMIIEKSSIVNTLYKDDADNPIFKVFYLKNVKGSFNNLGHVKGLEDKENFAKPVFFEL